MPTPVMAVTGGIFNPWRSGGHCRTLIFLRLCAPAPPVSRRGVPDFTWKGGTQVARKGLPEPEQLRPISSGVSPLFALVFHPSLDVSRGELRKRRIDHMMRETRCYCQILPRREHQQLCLVGPVFALMKLFQRSFKLSLCSGLSDALPLVVVKRYSATGYSKDTNTRLPIVECRPKLSSIEQTPKRPGAGADLMFHRGDWWGGRGLPYWRSQRPCGR
jgi:hypothetical protein